MKKLLYLCVIIIMSGCNCIMSQSVPSQYLYVGEECGAALPDYLPMFTYTDNCGIDTVWQSPTRGSWITQPTTTVLIRAVDKFNNHTDLMFTVTLLDTVPPVITLNDTTLVTQVGEMIDAMYDKADLMLARHQSWIDFNMLADSIPVNWGHYNDIHITWTDPNKFLFGTGMRVHTWQSECDTLIFR